MLEIMRRDFNQHFQVPINKNQSGTRLVLEQIAEYVGIDYLKISVSHFVAQPKDEFPFP